MKGHKAKKSMLAVLGLDAVQNWKARVPAQPKSTLY